MAVAHEPPPMIAIRPQLYIGLIYPRLELFYRGFLIIELVFLDNLAQLLLQSLCLLLLNVADKIKTGLAKHVNPFFTDAKFGPFLYTILRYFGLGLHLGEEKYLLNELLTHHQHAEAVDSNADTRSGRHTVLERTQEVLVNNHGLIVALIGQLHLVFKALFLVYGVVKLGVGVGQFLTVYHQLKAFGQPRFRAMYLCQRAHFYRIIGYEGRLDEGTFAELAEDFIDQLAFTERFVNAFHA